MKNITISSGVIYIVISLVFIAYCYLSYQVFTASGSREVIDGDSIDENGVVTDYSTLKKFFSNTSMLTIMTPIILVLILVLIIFSSS